MPRKILALQERGIEIVIYSLRHPTDRDRHPVHRQIRFPRGLPPRVPVAAAAAGDKGLAGVAPAKPAYRQMRALFLRDWRRDRTVNRLRRFGQALVLAREIDPDVVHLHAHFLHTPASVARYASFTRNAALELLSPRQGHLDHRGMGDPGEACRLPLARDLHRRQRKALEVSRR